MLGRSMLKGDWRTLVWIVLYANYTESHRIVSQSQLLRTEGKERTQHQIFQFHLNTAWPQKHLRPHHSVMNWPPLMMARQVFSEPTNVKSYFHLMLYHLSGRTFSMQALCHRNTVKYWTQKCTNYKKKLSPLWHTWSHYNHLL